MTPEFRISEPQLISLFQHIFSVCLVDIFIVSNLPYLKLVPPRYFFSSNEWSHNFSNLPSSNSPHMTSLLSSHTVFVKSSKHFGLVAPSTPSCPVFTASTLTCFGQWDISKWETSKALLNTCMLGLTLLKCSLVPSQLPPVPARPMSEETILNVSTPAYTRGSRRQLSSAHMVQLRQILNCYCFKPPHFSYYAEIDKEIFFCMKPSLKTSSIRTSIPSECFLHSCEILLASLSYSVYHLEPGGLFICSYFLS